jgi:hypothetical protein
MKSVFLHRAAQLVVVIGGFYTGVSLLPWSTCDGWERALRLATTALFILGLAVRYWWVILLLDWPFRVIRVALLLAVWMEVAIAACCVAESRAWVLALASVSWTGALTEAYNLASRQWQHPKAPLAATLFRDHVVGACAACAGGTGLIGIAIFAETELQPWLVLVLVLLDWLRLIEMVRRHQRLIQSA